MAADITFLTPLGAVLAVGALVPLAALLAVRRRAGRARRVLDLSPTRRRGLVLGFAALLSVGGLLGSAAAQPVLERTSNVRVRTDAEVFVVLDVSRSMLARRGSGSPARIERAKALASRFRSALPGVPIGIASFTDRVLPHLFPSADEDVFQATLERSIAIERPPPRQSLLRNATDLGVLTMMRSQRFFSPSARRRLVVVFTDGESAPVVGVRFETTFRHPPHIDLLLVQVWNEEERVFTRGAPERYRPDPTARATLDVLATAADASVFSEDESSAAAQQARRLLGSGPTAEEGVHRDTTALGPYLVLAAFLPLGLLLWRRDV